MVHLTQDSLIVASRAILQKRKVFLHHTTQVKPYIIKKKLSSYYISSHNRMVKTSFTTLINFLKFSNVLFTLLPHNL